MTFRFAIITVVAMTLACCGRQHDARLDRAADLAAQYPDSALALLDSIAPASLSTADRHYRDLLSIRAHDKAYHPHTSDSLIIDVIDYYADHRSAPDHFPMALYYGGRVYCELGDYPTAMKYFQDALDLLPPDTEDQALRCCVLSQYACLLNNLRLYDEAIPRIKSAIEIEELQHDTLNLVYDYQFLASIHQRSGDYDSAEQCLKKALGLSENMPIQNTTESLNSLATIKTQIGQIDSALILIRSIPDNYLPCARSNALSNTSIIYFKAGIYDTSYLYCQEILKGKDESPKAVAYQILLSPQMINRLPQDSLSKYIWDYRKLLERIFDGNQTEYALNQQSKYNYQLHDRERAKAERDRAALEKYVLVAFLVISLLVSTTLYFKSKSQRNVIKLREALDNIKILKSTHNADTQLLLDSGEINTSQLRSSEAKEKVLRERLKTELLAMYEQAADENYTPDDSILQSTAYHDLLIRIAQGKRINADDNLWIELQNEVSQISPNFKSNLILLTGGSLPMVDLHIALLIKCGIKPTPMKEIFGLSHSAITSRRKSLSKKIFGEEVGIKVIDAIFRHL